MLSLHRADTTLATPPMTTSDRNTAIAAPSGTTLVVQRVGDTNVIAGRIGPAIDKTNPPPPDSQPINTEEQI